MDEGLRNQMLSYSWWHSIDLGGGLVTPGAKPMQLMREEYENTFSGIEIAGRSLLDIGAWNGAFSIEAKRRGARHVTALDRPLYGDMAGVKASLEFAIKTTGFEISTCERDIEAPGALQGLGSFDIVLFLGVFYHLVDPILALRQIYPIVGNVLIMETHVEPTTDHRPSMIFYPGSELNNDSSNWWGPNIACVQSLLKTVGFRRVETIQPTDRNRVVCRAFK